MKGGARGIPDSLSPLATAVVMSITQSSPFDPKTDTNREFVRSLSLRSRCLTTERNKVGISFVSIFILIYHIFFWVCGIAHSLSWDYAPGVPQGEAANARVSWREKPICGFIWRHLPKTTNREGDGQDTESADARTHIHAQVELASCHSSRVQDEEGSIEIVQRTPPPSPRSYLRSPVQSHHESVSQTTPPISTITRPRIPSRSRRVLAAIMVIVTPISAIVAISLLIALVDPLKALFVSFEGSHSWRGPDGKPPLAFVIDTGTFVRLPPLREAF